MSDVKTRSPRGRHVGNRVDFGGSKRTVTVSYRYGAEFRVVVAPTIPEAHAQANRRWGTPDEVAAISTPRSIYNDLTGETRRRYAETGMHRTFEDWELPSERPE